MKKFILFALFLSFALPALAEDIVFGDFENEKDLSSWKAGFYDASSKEKPPVLSLSTENATSGSNSLKVTFDDGLFPMISTKTIPSANYIYSFKSISFDLTADFDTMVGIKMIQDKKSPFDTRVLVKKGLTKLNVTPSPLPAWDRCGSVDPNGGPVTELQIYFFKPNKGASVFIDRLRLQEKIRKKDISNGEHPIKAWYKSTFTVLGGKSDAPVDLKTLRNNLNNDFYEKQLGAKTPDEIEKLIRVNYSEIKKTKPEAVLSILRDGEKGLDPKLPTKEYKGWKNAYISTHSPDSGMTIAARTGGGCELFMRHRVQLFCADTSSIPAGSEILSAYFVLNSNKDSPGGSLLIAEAINRNWNESEVTAYTYDKDKFWTSVGGLCKTGDDPDCLPLILAYGYRKDKVSGWDFTEAVKYWTSGKNANNGFFFPCLDGLDYCSVSTTGAKNIKDRSALYVIYLPK